MTTRLRPRYQQRPTLQWHEHCYGYTSGAFTIKPSERMFVHYELWRTQKLEPRELMGAGTLEEMKALAERFNPWTDHPPERPKHRPHIEPRRPTAVVERAPRVVKLTLWQKFMA